MQALRPLAGVTFVICALTAIRSADAVRGRFSAERASAVAAAVVANSEPRAGAPGYSWLRLRFYAEPLNASDAAAVARGDLGSIHAPWNAVLQLTLDPRSAITQVDLSLPGHTCTIAASPEEVAAGVQRFQFDGTDVRLSAKGRHLCDMKFMGSADQTFQWEVDLEASVHRARERR
jgi:hypothetical protein